MRFFKMTGYLELLKQLQPKSKNNKYKVLDLFAGCGGLALGFEAVGFETVGYEKEIDAVKTYNNNLHGICHEEELTTETVFRDADIIIGALLASLLVLEESKMG